MSAGSLRIHELTDRESWNGLVVSLPHADHHQGYEWGEVRRTDGWRPRRIAVLDDAGACHAAVSILSKRLPVVGRTILYAPGGPLLRDRSAEDVWATLMEGIEAIADQERAIFLRVDPRLPEGDQQVRGALATSHFEHLADDWTTWNTPRIIMLMELQESEEVIRKKIRRRFRDYIASAPSRSLRVHPAFSEEEGRVFHTALAAAGRRKGLPVRGRRYFGSLWHEYLQDGKGVLLIAEHNGTIVGGLLGTRLGRTAYMLYVTQRDRAEGDPLHQGPVLYWEFVRWAKNHGCDKIDWGGVGTHYPPREDDPGFGVYLFKRGFNSSLQYMTGYYDRIFSPGYYRWFRWLERSSSAVAWTLRAKFNETILYADDLVGAGERKLRQFRFSASHRGLLTTLYWGAFGFLKPNRFFVLARKLSGDLELGAGANGVSLEIWPSSRLREWRRQRRGLSTEFFQNEIDGVESCVVALQGQEIAGLIWIYYPGDNSRLFQLRDGEAELNQGYVRPEFRNRGVFKTILTFACEQLARQGYSTAYAMVHWANTPSLRAFEDVGFRTTGRIRHFLAWRPKFRTARQADVVT